MNMDAQALSDARRCCVAPMMNWTHRHQRYFMRLITPEALLYTEMLTTGSLLHGNGRQLLAYHRSESPLALQLGGSDPAQLAECARMGEDLGYTEINLNLGCPSDRVRSGSFGACLMAQPTLVARCFAAMQAAVSIPVTVKHRIGIDSMDSYQHLSAFVATLADAGCRIFIIHARKAILSGLNPRQNRQIPPLRPDLVYRIKEEFPELTIVINGGITDLAQAQEHLLRVDGTMLGRAAYHNPYLMAEAGTRLINRTNGTVPERGAIFRAYAGYLRRELEKGTPPSYLLAHITGLFNRVAGAKKWRGLLSANMRPGTATEEFVQAALQLADELQATAQADCL